jgi:transcriptional regulator GlxA family with amidase domain
MTHGVDGGGSESGSIFRIGFLTVPDYSMIAFGNAIEPLRMANRLSGRELCRWTVLSLDGEPVRASNGLSIAPTAAAGEAGAFDIVFVCGGVDVQAACTGPLLAYLRRYARRGGGLGALCTGSYVLAKAGLLDGYRCAIHWENLAVVSEAFPHVEFSSELYVIDRNRYTASGGTAPLDLMLTLIRRFFGSEQLAYDISEEFIHERIRDSRDKQRVPLLSRVGPRQTRLLEAAALMEQKLEDPLGIDEIARAVGLSRRQLERLFRAHVAERPARYYLRLRLKRARQILMQSRVSITDAMVQTGFRSAAHFSKCYRREFGLPPSADRRTAAVAG